MARVGHTVHLTCDYDLERQRLNQVKWYKGSGEIYRYSPGEPERQKLFLVKNLNVDVSFIIVMAFLLSIVINNVIIAFTILMHRVENRKYETFFKHHDFFSCKGPTIKP